MPSDRPVRTPRPWSKHLPEDRQHVRWDAIVVGSGIGSMTTAAMLARAGWKVLVLEQHYVPGGYTHAFRRKGFTWDVGVHLVGDTSTKAMPGRLLSDLSGGALEWEPIGEVYDTFEFPDGFEISFPNDPAEFERVLKEAFPHAAHEVDAFFAEVRKTAASFQGWYLDRALGGGALGAMSALLARQGREAFSTTAAEVVERLVSDPKLRSVLMSQWGYHGSPPSQAAWAMQAIITRHFWHGAAYPVGGAPQIAKALLQTVADAGGWTRIVADVDQILVEDDRAVGVSLTNGDTYRAPVVVSGIGAWGTVTQLLPSGLASADWASRIASHHPAPAHVCLYLGFHGDTQAAGASRASRWLYDTWDLEESVWDISADTEIPDPGCLFCSFPSLKDPEHDPGPKVKHTGEIITFVPWHAFNRWKGTAWRKRGDDYEAFKQRLTEKLLARFFQAFPDLEPLLVHAELATPLSTDVFCKPYHGSIYGLNHSPERFDDPWLRPKTPLKGLWMTGQDVATCGVMGAMMGGAVSAVAIDPIGAGRQFQAAMAKR